MTYEIVSILSREKDIRRPWFPPATVPGCNKVYIVNKGNERSPAQCYHDAYLSAFSLPALVPDVQIYIHNDVEIYHPEWLPKVLGVFEQHPNCVVVGLGGATELGREGLYKRPYRIEDLSRGNYASNQRDWQVHGSHLSVDAGDVRVAVVDAFFMAVRTDFLLGCNGWPLARLSHHCMDLWICCEAYRKGFEVRAVGIDCLHKGGGMSTTAGYRQAKWLQGGTAELDHAIPHKWLHDEYRDVLPIRIKA